MGRILDALVDFFERDDWKVQPIEGQEALRMGFSGDNGNWSCFARAREQQDQALFRSICAVNAPPEKRQVMAEFICRANYGLVVGNFDFDFSDGEISYKTSVDAGDGPLTFELIKSMVYANVVMMDKYLPGIMAVLYAGKTPEEAITMVEGE